MKRNFRRKIFIPAMGVLLLLVAAVGGRHWYINSPGYGLPYHVPFLMEAKDRWTALGGTWEVLDGTMRNDSNDRGAKLLTGLESWSDYVVEGDVQTPGTGSVGLLARVSEAEVGENSLKGYLAGIRDHHLVLGVYDFTYHEIAKVPMPDPPRPSQWYHLRLTVNGCQVTAAANPIGLREVKAKPFNDPDCFRSGLVGLRSNGTGGVWRNVRVQPVDAPSPPAVGTAPALTAPPPPIDAPSSLPAQPIISLLSLPPHGSPVAAIRGSVILTRPVVFVQDPTSGVEVQSDGAMPLKIGDEVEVTGEVSLERSSPVIRNARFRLLRESVPVSPVVATANQIADGNFDGRFVQVDGYLRTMSEEGDGTVTLSLDGGFQSFRAILPAGRSRSHTDRLALDSRIRLRGVSVVDPRFNRAVDPFVILVRSAEDFEVVAGPPWWRPSTLIFATLVLLGLVFTFNYLYLLAKHWRLRAVAEERERLAHEIHDTLAQSFAGIGFQLQAIRNSVPADAEALQSQVDLAMSMARTSHGEARRSIASLRPESFGNIGLLPALRECAERMVKNGNVTVETYGEDGGRNVPSRIKDTLFRIGQEAIANSIRHADPDTIRIRLQRTRASIFLSVEDDGGGFVADSDHAGFGLLGMRKRAESISASLVVRSAPGSGTRVEVKAAVGSRFWLGVRT